MGTYGKGFKRNSVIRVVDQSDDELGRYPRSLKKAVQGYQSCASKAFRVHDEDAFSLQCELFGVDQVAYFEVEAEIRFGKEGVT